MALRTKSPTRRENQNSDFFLPDMRKRGKSLMYVVMVILLTGIGSIFFFSPCWAGFTEHCDEGELESNVNSNLGYTKNNDAQALQAQAQAQAQVLSNISPFYNRLRASSKSSTTSANSVPARGFQGQHHQHHNSAQINKLLNTTSKHVHVVLESLRQVAMKSAPLMVGGTKNDKGCNGNYLRLYGPGVGEFSNHILTIAHGLAVADALQEFISYRDATGSEIETVAAAPPTLYGNDKDKKGPRGGAIKNTNTRSRYTLLLPAYLIAELEPFALNLLHELYCVEFLQDGGLDDAATAAFLQRHDNKKANLANKTKARGFFSRLKTAVTGSDTNVIAPPRAHRSHAISRKVTPLLKSGDVFISASNLFYWGKRVSTTAAKEREYLEAPLQELRKKVPRRKLAGNALKHSAKNHKDSKTTSSHAKAKPKPSHAHKQSPSATKNGAHPAMSTHKKSAAHPAMSTHKKSAQQDDDGDDDDGAGGDDDVDNDDDDGDDDDYTPDDDVFGLQDEKDRPYSYWESAYKATKVKNPPIYNKGADFLFIVNSDGRSVSHEKAISNGVIANTMLKSPRVGKSLNNQLLLKLVDPGHFARYTIGCLAAIWTDIHVRYTGMATYVSKAYLDGQFYFNSIHKRNFEGTCNEEFRLKTTPERDFGPLLLGLDRDELSKIKMQNSVTGYDNPLCHMSPNWVVPLLHRKSSSRLVYIASDGQTDNGAWRDISINPGRGHPKDKKVRALIGIDALKLMASSADVDMSIFDLFMAVLGKGVFIGNPRSTYSLQIFLLRAIVESNNGKTSNNNKLRLVLPLALDFDIYFNIHVMKSWNSRNANNESVPWIPMNDYGSIEENTWTTKRIFIHQLQRVSQVATPTAVPLKTDQKTNKL